MIASKNNILKRVCKMRLGICDDNKIDIEKVERVIETKICSGLFVFKEYKPEELLVDIEEGLFDCEVLVIGVCFENGKFNGIDLVDKVNQFFPLCEVIYFSNYIEYALRVYETKHCYYILKSELDKMLPLAIDKAIIKIQDNVHSDVLKVTCNGVAVFIDKRKILYIERENRKVNIVTKNKKYSCYLSLIKLIENLGDYMVRVHGGYIANLAEIVYLRDNVVCMSNNAHIPLGRTYEKTVRQRYREFWGK
ncbi:MAG: LytTR family transcriptional regulator DNA-binding domain-containing protein [Clostridium sp.]|nr:LytTR family transcriptional regulator DNA-binding domain-containing protein [Clostridium sp.]MCM1171278.1 LytTR family transcriptional regulator DNA-binding domain-containing protein [Clostridium sp.]MCM1207452.1 LytTR family transcriptional regulator DNA-binding domain-containing protein [Ruminococcus sp.]